MKIAPLDLRQQRFRKTFRGLDRAEVTAFLSDTADDYEAALREIDRLRDQVARMEEQLREHRSREAALRDTLITAQKLADEVRENAKREARVIVREAHQRADQVLQLGQARFDELEAGMNELRLKRRDVESSLEASIAALRHALDFIRTQEPGEKDDKIRLYRPRLADRDSAEAAATPVALDVAQRQAQR